MARLQPSHFSALLRRCIASKALQRGKQVHAQMLAAGIDPNGGPLYSKLTGFYASCGDNYSSTLLFRTVRKPTAFAWNWLILASAFRGDCDDALDLFAQMLAGATGVCPNKHTFAHVLKACTGLLDIRKGKEVHSVVAASGLESDVSVANALVDMYCKCGSLDSARRLFDKMRERNIVTWTTMINGCFSVGNIEEGSFLLESMKSEGRLEPNDFTWNAMIAGYARNGDCDTAFRLFKEMKNDGRELDLVSWNTMIVGLCQNDRGFEALEVFDEMIGIELRPNAVTIAGLLPAYGKIGSMQKIKQVHGFIYRMELHANVFTETALIDVYSKCGNPDHARRVFDLTATKNAATYNAMIGCHGKHGEVEASFELFDRMQKENVEVNEVTYTCLFSACRHAGLVDKGLELFSSMKHSEVEPNIEHYACLVDLLCRVGHLDEAYQLVKAMPSRDSIVGTFVAGCRIHGRSDLAEMMAKELGGAAGSVLLSNVYAERGIWQSVENVRNLMKDKGLCKIPGCSWIEEKDVFGTFCKENANNASCIIPST